MARRSATWARRCRACLVMIGDRLGLYKAMAGAGPDHVRGPGEEDGVPRAVLAGVAAEPGRGRVCRVRQETREVLAAARSRRSAWRMSTSPGYHLRGVRRHPVDEPRRAEDREGVQDGRGCAVGRPRRVPVLRHGAVLRGGLPRESGQSWIPALDGVKAAAGGRRGGGGCGVRARDLDDSDGAGVPASRSLSGSIRTRRRSTARGRRRPRRASRTCTFEVADAADVPGPQERRRVRLHRVLRLPARHGRPGRVRRRTCASGSRRTGRGWSSSRSRATRPRRT